MSEVTSFYIDAMHADERALGVQTPDFEPRATDHVGAMLSILQRLETNGLAYKSEDGDVNYAVRDFPGSGMMSGQSPAELRDGERVAVDSNKRDPLDFVLWQGATQEA